MTTTSGHAKSPDPNFQIRAPHRPVGPPQGQAARRDLRVPITTGKAVEALDVSPGPGLCCAPKSLQERSHRSKKLRWRPSAPSVRCVRKGGHPPIAYPVPPAPGRRGFPRAGAARPARVQVAAGRGPPQVARDRDSTHGRPDPGNRPEARRVASAGSPDPARGRQRSASPRPTPATATGRVRQRRQA